MIVIQLESGNRHTKLLEGVTGYVAQIRVRHPQDDLLLGGEFAAQCLGQLVERLHLFTQHLDTLPYVVTTTTTATATATAGVIHVGDPAGRGRRRLVDNGTGKLLLSAGARADLAAYGAMQTRAGREAQQRVENAGHAVT